ncbi:MAG: ABC transporter ATP-binding protein [Alphaproteobacteria bacterium]|nr:ABC transporter ATP-binding protein [Alphaproteobacteria bacterium]
MSGILVEDLAKTFFRPEPVAAVDGVSFRCDPGEVFGLLGPNGAGKTTTLRILSTLLRPDAGRAVVAGHDVTEAPEAVRASIGYLSTSTGLYPRLTPRELLRSFAALQGVSDPKGRAEAMLARFGVLDFADARCDQLSTGMKQKVSIARALVADPPVLILDEPTTGLDVVVAQDFLAAIREARDEGRCVLFSTHIMSQAERVCDRVGILHQGRLLAVGTLDELRERAGAKHLEDIFIRLIEGARA